MKKSDAAWRNHLTEIERRDLALAERTHAASSLMLRSLKARLKAAGDKRRLRAKPDTKPQSEQEG